MAKKKPSQSKKQQRNNGHKPKPSQNSNSADAPLQSPTSVESPPEVAPGIVTDEMTDQLSPVSLEKNAAKKQLPKTIPAESNQSAIEPKLQLVSATPLSQTRAHNKSQQPKNESPAIETATDDVPLHPVVTDIPGGELPRSQSNKKPKKNKVQTAPVHFPPVTPSRTAAISTRPDLPATIDTSNAPKPRGRRISRRKLARYSLLLLVLVGLPAVGYVVFQQHEQAAQTANQRLISEVSHKAVVPGDEVPSVSTVVDESKITQQFLRNARKGDKVLLYFQAGQAVVYRPETGQIVNMGPLQAPSPRVFLRSGAPHAAITKIGKAINDSNNFVVVSNDVSTRQDYKRTLVIDVSGNRPDIAQRLATALHATVSPLPDGESRPDADLLVIIGNDNVQP